MANMKRGGDFDSGMEGGKRSRGGGGHRFEMRVLVPSKVRVVYSFFKISK